MRTSAWCVVRGAWCVVVGAITTGGGAQAQSRSWENREYGIGVVSYAAMETYSARDVILATPVRNADTVAILNRDSLCFTATRTCVRSYERMIEFGYEIPGWAILRFSADSQWVQVSLAPSDPGPVGWVRLRPGSVDAVLWRTLLRDKGLFFLRTGDAAFYMHPERGALAPRARVPADSGHGRRYVMIPLAVRGRWLRVAITNEVCGDTTGDVRPDTLWIEYLSPQGRPRVFYPTRGC